MRTLAALCAAALVLTACTGGVRTPGRDSRPHRGLESLWRDYQALPRERALAIAGDPDGLWVAGAAGGEANRRDAERRALEQCGIRRLERRLLVPCRLYATGDRIVWRSW